MATALRYNINVVYFILIITRLVIGGISAIRVIGGSVAYAVHYNVVNNEVDSEWPSQTLSGIEFTGE